MIMTKPKINTLPVQGSRVAEGHVPRPFQAWRLSDNGTPATRDRPLDHPLQ